MRLLIYADPHWSSYSSILRGRGSKYSIRLENLINTLNWIETTAKEYGCYGIVCLGDFFDKCDLNSEELTALQDIGWSDLYHYFIVGNHEIGRGNLEFSSAHLFNLCPNSCVIDNVSVIHSDDTNIIFLPYILELDRKPLKDYIENYKDKETTIVLSHNDIKGIQMGQYNSQEGFSIEEIKENCDLFINGHLHNGVEIDNGIINLGNITGQNFSEDALRYKHQCIILDTDAHSFDYIENPFALNFYKIDLSDVDDGCYEGCYAKLSGVGRNAVVTIKANSGNLSYIKDLVNNFDNIIEARVILSIQTDTKKDIIDIKKDDLTINHLSKFIEYVVNNIGESNLIREELNKVVGES